MAQPQIKGTQLDPITLLEPVHGCMSCILGGDIVVVDPKVGEALVYCGEPLAWRNNPSSGGVIVEDGLQTSGVSPDAVQVISVDNTVARLNASLNTFASDDVVALNLSNTNGQPDAKIWRVANNNGQFVISTRTDEDTSGSNALVIDRVGVNVKSLTVPAPLHLTSKGTGKTSALQLNSPNPTVVFNDTDAIAGEGMWDITAAPKALEFRTRTDAHGTGTTWLEVVRSGTTVKQINLKAASVTVNGKDISALEARVATLEALVAALQGT